MIRNAQFKPGLSLATLQGQLNRFEALWGALVGIGNQGGFTIGSYDGDETGNRRIRLVPGAVEPSPGQSHVDTGQVFIVGQLQTVTALRES